MDSHSNQRSTLLFSEKTDIDTFFKHIDRVIANGAKSLLLFSADENHYDEASINTKLKSLSIPICGGIFPQIIYQNKSYQQGCIVCGFNFDIQVTQIDHLSNTDFDYNQQLELAAKQFEKNKNMMVLVDGNSLYLSRFMENLYNYFGDETTYFGGGAGTLRFMTTPCLYTNEGLLADAALLVAMHSNMFISVEHGWEKLAGPFVITKSNQNAIQMIDYQPAFERYKEVIENDSNCRFDREAFFDIAKYYPLGIERLNGNIVVRDPVKCIDNTLICVAEVPQNSIAYILKGTDQNLIDSAKKAATKIQHTDSSMPIILFNCISLSLVLNNKLSDELKAISSNLPPHTGLIGASSIGEIASSSSGTLEFYNKTTVLASFQEESA
jgi:hypothetical protein